MAIEVSDSLILIFIATYISKAKKIIMVFRMNIKLSISLGVPDTSVSNAVITEARYSLNIGLGGGTVLLPCSVLTDKLHFQPSIGQVKLFNWFPHRYLCH
ncbi:hypothetical protein [Rahnella inusitata]|uniref:hypothetical protein n=1 Tax=Rahnella inusitata TaxID=58169 RepID=UPI0039AF0A37